MNPIIIGVAGGTGAGKTTVIRHITDSVGSEDVVILNHDSYYHDLSHLSLEERRDRNFDHPSALDSQLLIQHIKSLKKGDEVEVPIYNFSKHVRKTEKRHVSPARIVLIDGILILSITELRNLLDIKIYIDTDDDIRLLRRIRRDILKRDRDLEGILHQYEKHVRPMHLKYVEPSKRHADIILPRGGQNKVTLDMITAFISRTINN